MSEYILQVKEVSKSFVGVQALKDMSIDIKKGEVHSLSGENGCGKSTLIKIISGFYEADKGKIILNGQEYSDITPLKAIQEGIQVIYQDFSIFPNLTVMENLSINFELMNKRKFVSYKRMKKIAQEALDTINFKVDLYEKVENLTVVEKQMIAICRALLYDAKLIIMDEPTTSLNKREIKELFNVIRELQKKDIAIMFVSHKLEELFEISERFTIMRSGQKIITADTEELNEEKFSYYMTGRKFEYTNFEPKNFGQKEILNVKNLTKSGKYEDISFQLKKGEILGITGLQGSGRSDIVQTLFGVDQPDSGEIYLNDKKVSFKNIKQAMEEGIGYVPADRLTEGLFLTQSISDNILITELEKLSTKLGVLDTEKSKSVVKKWVENLSIKTTNPENPVQTLSGGNQQKVVLSKWLTQELSVLILNGPTVGVDIGAKYDIYKIIKDLANQGLAVIVISDDLSEIINNCNRLIVIREGRLSDELETIDLTESELTRYIY